MIENLIIRYHRPTLDKWRSAYLGRESLKSGQNPGSDLRKAEATIKTLNLAVGLGESVVSIALLVAARRAGGFGKAAAVLGSAGLALDALDNLNKLGKDGV